MGRAQFVIVAAAAVAVAAMLSSMPRQEQSHRATGVAVRDEGGRQVPRAAPALRPFPRRPRDPLPSPPSAGSTSAGGSAAGLVATQSPAMRDEAAKASQGLTPPLIGHKPAAGAAPAAAKERPLAREALALVGADPLAEAVWVEAINDPQRSAHERSDLIEDLNEEGFPDPKHVTADDLPLIESRIVLIEQLAPDAMDEVNFEAFAEAYKDLVNMYARASGM